MDEWQKKQTVLVEKINRICAQPFLAKMLGTPDINPLRVSALMLAFTEQERTKPHVQKQIAAAILIQLALDTHDRIEPVVEEIKQKHQLIVLAGDYFSGMYYRTLAEAGCIHHVGLLAEAVKRVNERKTALHQKECKTADEVFQTVRTIESEIICAVYRENKAEAEIIEAVSSLLTAERLLREKEKPFAAFSALVRLLGDEALAEKKIDQHLHQLKQTILKHIQQLDSYSAAVIQADGDRLFDRALRYAKEG